MNLRVSILTCVLGGLFALSYGNSASASETDIASATEALKSCVEIQVQVERARKDPNVENLLNACKTELKAVLEQVPADVREYIRHEIRHQTDYKLKKNK